MILKRIPGIDVKCTSHSAIWCNFSSLTEVRGDLCSESEMVTSLPIPIPPPFTGSTHRHCAPGGAIDAFRRAGDVPAGGGIERDMIHSRFYPAFITAAMSI